MSLPDATQSYDALAEAKRLLRSIRSGALASISDNGAPLASLTALATMPGGEPILLLSRLALHTRQLERDGRCSLLLAQGGRGDPLAHPRLSLTGTAAPAGERRDAAATRFLARNPKSKLYAGFPDFSFWIVAIDKAHLNGGFARAATFESSDLLTATAGSEDLIAGETGALEHMNADHRDALSLYATKLLRLPEGEWRVSGIDPEGLDLVSGDRTGRLAFLDRIRDGSGLRRCLVTLAEEARRITD